MNIYACVCLIFSSSHSHNDYKTYVVTETCTQTWVQLLPCKHNLPQQHLEIQTQVAIEEMIIFLLLSLSDILIHAESLSVSQAPPPATHPHLVTECRWCWHVTSGSSSLHVLHRHFSTHFPFSQEAWLWSSCNDVKKETEIPQQQLWANECILETFLCRCYRIGFLSRWRIKGDQNGSNLLLLRFLTPCLLWGDLCVGSEEWNLFSNWDEMLCGLCDSMLASVDKDMLKETFSGS